MLCTLPIFLLSIALTTVTASNWAKTSTSSIYLRSITPNFKPEVVNELKDFLKLIPQATIDEIAAKHFVIDGDFRHAVRFLRSSDFKQLIQNAEQLPEILDILNYLHLISAHQHQANLKANREVFEPQMDSSVCELTQRQLQLENTIDNIPVQIELLPNSDEDTAERHIRSFTSFVEDVLEHFPRDTYVRMIDEKRERNTDFAEFYAALRSPNFQQMADAAMNTVNVAKIVQELSSNKIDPVGLELIVLRVISWGPSVDKV